VPGKRNHGTAAVFANYFVDHGRTPQRGVLVVTGGEAEVLPEDAGEFAGQIVNAV
jgi:hypothetical protein